MKQSIKSIVLGKSKKIKYENKIVAFLDILGFKNAVHTKDVENIFRILNLNYFVVERQQQLKKRFINLEKGKNVKVFSDSVYLSYPAERCWDLMSDVACLMIGLASMGFYFRGGIACGKVFDDDKILFGPAVIEAYEIESQLAVYPRVVISQEAVNELAQYGNKEDFKHYIRQDSDGCYYVNFLVGARNLYYTVSDVRNPLVKNYRNAKKKNNQKIVSKLVWLINYFNSVLDDINEDMSIAFKKIFRNGNGKYHKAKPIKL